MAITSNLPIEYHQQDEDYYCGAACVLMLLQHLGAGHLSQIDLYNDNHNQSTIEPIWASGPDGLELTMNQRNPNPNLHFDLREMSTEYAISREIAWSIYSGTAAIALVYGYQHWVTVIGFDATSAPQSNTDKGFNITGFRINNPWPPTPKTSLVPPHVTGDACGQGGNNGIANEHISYNTWQNDYMTGVPAGHWQGKFLALCRQIKLVNSIGGGGSRKKIAAKTPKPKKTKVISKRLAMKNAVQSFFLLQRRLVAGRGLPAAIPFVTKEAPQLVRRLDRENEHYYLVPVGQPGAGSAQSMVSIDAHSGEYKQSLELKNNETDFFKPLDNDSIIGLAKRKTGIKKNVKINTDTDFQIEDELVWKPCLESFSPYWPFHIARLGEKTVYIRIDGEVFNDLTTGLAGS